MFVTRGKEKGKRGTVSFITAEGKGKAPPFARQKVFLGLCVVAPEASRGDLSIGDIGAMLAHSHHEGRRGSLKNAPSCELDVFLFFLQGSRATVERFFQVLNEPASCWSWMLQLFFDRSHFYLTANQGRHVSPLSQLVTSKQCERGHRSMSA